MLIRHSFTNYNFHVIVVLKPFKKISLIKEISLIPSDQKLIEESKDSPSPNFGNPQNKNKGI